MEHDKQFSALISDRLGFPQMGIASAIALFREGATIPFISRYRKERTGQLDEVALEGIRKELDTLDDVLKRKETIRSTIEELNLLTPELAQRIAECWDPVELEDLYLPFKPKKRTRASIARALGLEPLAELLMAQSAERPERLAAPFVKGEVSDVKHALDGACDILAERVSEDLRSRNLVRTVFSQKALLTAKAVKGKEQEGVKYRDYFSHSEPLKRVPSHRMLAILRGTGEGFLRHSLDIPDDPIPERLDRLFVRNNGPSGLLVREAVLDGYKRLLFPSIENEFLAEAKKKAGDEAIRVFASNLRQLLLATPLGSRNVLAIDPGYRTGCKIVCLDGQGNLLHNETVYPHAPQKEEALAMRKIESLADAYHIEAIAIGDGTAGRETEALVRRIRFRNDLRVFVVSEDGASVYSASPVAREEFPSYDVTVRGAISIGRRLIDPLAELVKIEPRSLGVGQYQHDVDQNDLHANLDRVVESCVNLVGVNLNTASRHLLAYVSGIGPKLAGQIVLFRTENGPFQSRAELKKVPKLGPKAFEQSAGFLRIAGAKNPLDNSAVHPESYGIVEKMARDLRCTLPDLLASDPLRKSIVPERYLSDQAGLPTILDILQELARPGRDPRTMAKVLEFSPDVFNINDLQVGMILPGIVTNITNFGAFVDVGVKQDGLVHISQMADRYISNPLDVVKLHQHVQVKVLEVDQARKRIQLSLKIGETPNSGN